MHSMVWRAVPPIDCWKGPIGRTPFGRHFCCRFPFLLFLPVQRKARGTRLPMSGFWGKGEFEGEGPLFTAGKRGPPPQDDMPCQITNKTKTGPSLEETAPFRIVGAVVDAGKRGTGAAGTAPNAAFVAAPVPCCSALNEGGCVGRAFPRAFGKGSLKRGPLVTAGKRGPFSSIYSCLRPALPWWPGRSAVPRWWG